MRQTQMLLLFVGICRCSELSEPNRFFFSRFEWQEKLLERTIRTDLQMQEYVKELQKAMDSIKVHNDEFQGLKDDFAKIAENLKATVENQTEELEQLKQNVTILQELIKRPTVLFSAKDVGDKSPNRNEVIIFPKVIQNIGNAYNPGTGVFTPPVNGTYSFSVQACTHNSKWAQFQLVVDSGDKTILVISHYNGATSSTTNADSVAYYLTESQRVWVQSYCNSGTTATLYFQDLYCWNHFSGVLLTY